jgi:hypothetical protein
MIKEVLKNLFGQFVKCLETRLAAPSEVSASVSRSQETAAVSRFGEQARGGYAQQETTNPCLAHLKELTNAH